MGLFSGKDRPLSTAKSINRMPVNSFYNKQYKCDLVSIIHLADELIIFAHHEK